MNKKHLLISAITLFSTINAKTFSFKSISSYFSSDKYENVEQREIPLKNQSHIIIETINGPIHIQTWQQQKVLLKAAKRSNKEELLSHMSIDTKSNNDTLIIKTIYDQEPIKGSVAYELLVPAKINVSIKAGSSPIKIEHIKGTVAIRNQNGNIELNAVQGPIAIEVINKGSIVVDQANSTIKAITHQGNIDIHDAKKSIFASTDNGKIKTTCKNVPHGSTIKLDASRPITLQLPTGTNANLQAETEQGRILCEHYLTIKPFITQLNPQAWNHFKQNVNGSLGNGGANICLRSVSGNIKIAQETT